MNKFKALIALIGFTIVLLFSGESVFPAQKTIALLIFSGILGLGIGDTFLLKSFVSIGPGRTLVLFGFQPVILGILGYLVLNQKLEQGKLIGVFFCIACVLVLSIEGRKSTGSWQFKGILFAFLGMFLDASGLILTRYAFDMDSELTVTQSNVIRVIGAFVVYFVLSAKSASKKLFEGIKFLDKSIHDEQ